MEHPEGFFPERQILAMRRQQLLPAAPANHRKDSTGIALWWGFSIAFFPIVLSLSFAGFTVRPGAVLIVCYALAACALAGILIGAYRGLRSSKPART